jgi:trehalose synthase
VAISGRKSRYRHAADGSTSSRFKNRDNEPGWGQHGHMREVQIHPIPLARLVELLAPDRSRRLESYAERAHRVLRGRTVWNINATAQGGGVAEMLQALLAYGRGAGVDTRWLVLTADPEFFTITKRLHNLLHGSAGDGGRLGPDERMTYQAVLQSNLEMASSLVKPGDIVLLHDPQTAGMVDGLQKQGALVIWRCHIGADTSNEFSDIGWGFLRELIEPADGFIFSRAAYAPAWVPRSELAIIPPSLDPFSAKNLWLSGTDVEAALREAALVDLRPGDGTLRFTRRDGSSGLVRPHRNLLIGGEMVPAHARVVMQVSRWDRLKDMTGVLSGFAENVRQVPDDVHLMLVGPDVSGVSDDPEGAEVLDACISLRSKLPAEVRDRTHLCCLPMDDVDENAHLVNALQRYASVVVQKSLVEGFGLTVTEPMWKARPVVASTVGGIQDQIVDGVSGLLLPDPTDVDAMMRAVSRFLDDPAFATAVGAAAQERVRDRFLGDRHLIQYVDLFDSLIAGT